MASGGGRSGGTGRDQRGPRRPAVRPGKRGGCAVQAGAAATRSCGAGGRAPSSTDHRSLTACAGLAKVALRADVIGAATGGGSPAGPSHGTGVLVVGTGYARTCPARMAETGCRTRWPGAACPRLPIHAARRPVCQHVLRGARGQWRQAARVTAGAWCHFKSLALKQMKKIS